MADYTIVMMLASLQYWLDGYPDISATPHGVTMSVRNECSNQGARTLLQYLPIASVHTTEDGFTHQEPNAAGSDVDTARDGYQYSELWL